MYFKYSRNPCALVKGRLVQLLWKTVWSFLKKLKMDVPFDLVMPLLRIYHKKPENTTLKEYTHPYVHCSIIYNSQDLEAIQMPNSIQMVKKISGTNIQWNITPAIKNNKILLFKCYI